jgi:hypothetical protein
MIAKPDNSHFAQERVIFTTDTPVLNLKKETHAMEKVRDRRIDFLRFFGALVVMLAHTEPPDWLFQLRNFGTPLLIVVSALSVAVVFRDRPLQTLPFLKRRLVKLTVPPWLFLTIFFGVAFGYSILRGKAFPFSVDDVLTSYTFDSGIGYVWIFKVYLTIALLTPWLVRFKAGVRDRTSYFAILIVLYAIYEVLNWFLQADVDSSPMLGFADNVIVVLPYSILFAYGLQLDELPDRQVVIVTIVALMIFLTMAASKFQQVGHLVATQPYKYPPTLYYLSYALFCINSLYLSAKSALLERLPAIPIAWLSSNLLWVYLWHILGLFAWHAVLGPGKGSLLGSCLELAFVLAFAVTLTWLQKRALDRWLPDTAARSRRAVRAVFG